MVESSCTFLYGEELSLGFENLGKESLKEIKAFGDKLLTITDSLELSTEIGNFPLRQYLTFALSKVAKKALKDLNLPLLQFLLEDL